MIGLEDTTGIVGDKLLKEEYLFSLSSGLAEEDKCTLLGDCFSKELISDGLG